MSRRRVYTKWVAWWQYTGIEDIIVRIPMISLSFTPHQYTGMLNSKLGKSSNIKVPNQAQIIDKMCMPELIKEKTYNKRLKHIGLHIHCWLNLYSRECLLSGRQNIRKMNLVGSHTYQH